MNVLMFGWEFAPLFSGGLGVVCKALSEELVKQNVNVTFVMPKKYEKMGTTVPIIGTDELTQGIKCIAINSPLSPYLASETYENVLHAPSKNASHALYGENLYDEVARYTSVASAIAKKNQFDVIHAHDWMTYQAGIAAKKVSKKPLLVHIHNTVFDRSPHAPSRYEYAIEKQGFEEADTILAVSDYTKNIIVENYGIPQEKIVVVHNAVDETERIVKMDEMQIPEKIVLFLGRITLQKGPEYFLEAAKQVLHVYPHVKFVIAGSGDMQGSLVQRAAESGIAQHVLFAGPLDRTDAYRAFKMADVYVMPSVSEPFGVTALEAALHNTPVIMSKTAGAGEVLKHALKVDFWDTQELANKILCVLRYDALPRVLREGMQQDMVHANWMHAASACLAQYQHALAQRGMHS